MEEGKLEEPDAKKLIDERKEKIVSFIKKKAEWISYVLLGIVVFISVRIRTRNMHGLKDVTTGTWTLGPDLDPFLFLRLAKHIVENGMLMAVDMMRYVPLGSNIAAGDNFIFHYYSIAWFHKIASLFGSESVTYSAIIYPVFMFALTVVAFFLLVRIIFVDSLGKKKASIVAIISCFFLSISPSLIPRTIAGIPEKESGALLYLFMAFYFFLKSWKAKKEINKYGFALLSGVFTGGMALIWGGYAFIFIILSPTLFVAFILNKVRKKEFVASLIFMLASFSVMSSFGGGYNLKNLFVSTTTGSFVAVLFIIFIDILIYKTNLKNKLPKKIEKIPPRAVSLFSSIIVLILLTGILFGASFVPNQLGDIKSNLIKPATSRLIQTVAENRQPYFNEWAGNFGPILNGFPLFFWLFFVGSIQLFYSIVKKIDKKDKIILTITYVVFLVALIFSRYAPNSIFNGENSISILLYAMGAILFFGSFGHYYYQYYKNNKLEKFESIRIEFIFLFIFFFLSIVSARGLIRLVMMVVPPSSIIVSYFAFNSYQYISKNARKENKLFGVIGFGIIIVAVLFAGYSLYKISNSQASVYVPSGYNQQWQKAMSWVRENTPENAVFGHWWDYGYWLQSIGERATVLDGGNEISYWNHLMGRYALTGTSNEEALEFLYVHNTTNFLIDSTDIGKYTAFSSIGSDETYDRTSWITGLNRDNSQTVERKNSTLIVYTGGVGLDEDVVYESNGSKIFLPSGQAGVGAIVVDRKSNGVINSVSGIYINQGSQYNIPLRYYYEDGSLIDFGEGLEAGVFIYPRITLEEGGGINVENEGAALYLSKRTVRSQLTRLYLFGEENEGFKIAHIEDDFLIADLKSQGLDLGNFVNFQGFRGPIKIWDINYPLDIEYREEFLDTTYPDELRIA